MIYVPTRNLKKSICISSMTLYNLRPRLGPRRSRQDQAIWRKEAPANDATFRYLSPEKARASRIDMATGKLRRLPPFCFLFSLYFSPETSCLFSALRSLVFVFLFLATDVSVRTFRERRCEGMTRAAAKYSFEEMKSSPAC